MTLRPPRTRRPAVLSAALLLAALAAGTSSAGTSTGSSAGSSTGTSGGPGSDASDHRASPPGGLSRVEPTIAVDPRNPRVVVTAANDAEGSSVAAYWSGDGGLTFSRRTAMPEAPGAPFESDPHLAFDSRGRLFAAYLTYGPGGAGGLSVVRSDDGGRTWPSTPRLVAANSSTATRCAFADFPALAVDRRRDVVHVAWQLLDQVDGGDCIAGDDQTILVSSSRDGGRRWSPPVAVPRLPGQASYLPTLTVAPDGTVYVTHLSTGGGTPTTCPSSGYGLHVVVARSTDGGRRFTPSVAQAICGTGTHVATPLVGLRSYTGATWRLPSSVNTVVDPRSGVLVSVAGAQDPVTGRQVVSVVRSEDRGRSWRPGGAVAESPGVEQQMPRIAVGNDGRMSLVWLAQLPGGLTWPSHSWSRDGGRTWTAPQRLSAAPNPRGGPDAQFFLGDYLGNEVDRDGRAHPVWTDPREVDPDLPGGTIYTRAVAPQG